MTNNKPIHIRIKQLIEETNDAFSSCRGAVNADYAEFATMSISAFKNTLAEPRLTREKLVGMIRSGGAQYKKLDPEKACWSTFMAQYIERTMRQAEQNNHRPERKQSKTQDANISKVEEKPMAEKAM